MEVRDDDGNHVGYIENLGGPGTQYIRYGDNYPWGFTSASMFGASYLKLREFSIGYSFPSKMIRPSIGLNDLQLSVYTRNVILWTEAGVGVDPEHAFQPVTSKTGGGMNWEQGFEKYNVRPWNIPVGVRLTVKF